jgi:uncharacterized protein YbjT (DUF2867 family)
MQSSRPTLVTLVIGATGKTGRRVADRLKAAGRPVRRASRSSEIAFDWSDRASWAPALAGAGAVYITYHPDLAEPGAPEAVAAFVQLAERAGVARAVLLSGRGEPEAQACERILLESGLEATVVRASWFAQNFSEGAFAPLVASGRVTLPAGDVPEPFIDIDDIAEVAVAALTEDGHGGRVYEVTGPRALTFAEAVSELSAATGREIAYEQVPTDAFLAGMAEAGVSPREVALLEYLFGTVLDGRNARPADGVERALGRPPRDFHAFAAGLGTATAASRG